MLVRQGERVLILDLQLFDFSDSKETNHVNSIQIFCLLIFSAITAEIVVKLLTLRMDRKEIFHVVNTSQTFFVGFVNLHMNKTSCISKLIRQYPLLIRLRTSEGINFEMFLMILCN